jgi:hypothetical protein
LEICTLENLDLVLAHVDTRYIDNMTYPHLVEVAFGRDLVEIWYGFGLEMVENLSQFGRQMVDIWSRFGPDMVEILSNVN